MSNKLVRIKITAEELAELKTIKKNWITVYPDTFRFEDEMILYEVVKENKKPLTRQELVRKLFDIHDKYRGINNTGFSSPVMFLQGLEAAGLIDLPNEPIVTAECKPVQKSQEQVIRETLEHSTPFSSIMAKSNDIINALMQNGYLIAKKEYVNKAAE